MPIVIDISSRALFRLPYLRQSRQRAPQYTDARRSNAVDFGCLSPVVLEKLLIQYAAPTISLKEMIIAADLPWAEQAAMVFGAG